VETSVNLLFVCGTATITQGQIAATIRAFHVAIDFLANRIHSDDPSLPVDAFANVTDLRRLWIRRRYGQPIPTSELLELCRHMKCKDPRDLVYAVLGIGSGLESPVLRPK